MTKTPKRLIVSFIGGADLAYFDLGQGKTPKDASDVSPIVRLLTHLGQPEITDVLLFDDKPSDDSRQNFCDRLKVSLTGLGLKGMKIDLKTIRLPKGPTDYNALYYEVWKAVPTGARGPNEIVFHLSSGTPAMQATFLLAANCLSVEKVRLFETSKQNETPLEVNPPYELAMRERQRGTVRKHSLDRKARSALLAETVIDDPQVEATYAALHGAAVKPGRATAPAPTVLILGPTGSGKWHAARQFACWRSGETAEWLAERVGEIGEKTANVLIWHLDAWPTESLRSLSAWRVQNPAITVAATWRTDVMPCAPLEVATREGLRCPQQVRLPDIGSRSDIVRLGEAVARRNGIAGGKLKQRLQFDLLTDAYPAGLHDLAANLAIAASWSKGLHPERAAYLEVDRIADANEALSFMREAYEVLAGLKFGQGRPKLADVCEVIEAATIRYALMGGRSQDDVAKLLGCGQPHVSDVLRRKIDLAQWRTRIAANANGD